MHTSMLTLAAVAVLMYTWEQTWQTRLLVGGGLGALYFGLQI